MFSPRLMLHRCQKLVLGGRGRTKRSKGGAEASEWLLPPLAAPKSERDKPSGRFFGWQPSALRVFLNGLTQTSLPERFFAFCVIFCLIFCMTISMSSKCLAQQADDFGSLKPGDKAIAWENLAGVDGKPHSLNELTANTVVVVCFTSNTCPYSVDYEDRMIALQKKYQESGAAVKLIAINSNGVKADDLESMKARAKEKMFNFTFLKDESQSVAKSWGALYTPEFFVLNKERIIVFRGAMDDQTDASKVTQNYVEQAITAAIEGKMPSITEVPARGCAVRYKRSRR